MFLALINIHSPEPHAGTMHFSGSSVPICADIDERTATTFIEVKEMACGVFLQQDGLDNTCIGKYRSKRPKTSLSQVSLEVGFWANLQKERLRLLDPYLATCSI